VFHLGVDGGVMITASHNPSEDNGFKIVCGKSTIHGAEIQKLRQKIESRAFRTDAAPGRASEHDILTDYIGYIAEHIKLGPRRFKVVVDGGNGTGGLSVIPILKKLGVDVEEIYCDPDGRFPNHHPDPTVPANLKHLQDAVKAQHAELGIAFDGDSDRIGAVDENGEVIYGDMLLLIFGREILTRKPGATIIGEVKCSQMLYDELNRLGGNAIMYKTGHSLIKAKMKLEHAELAGEMSGHMFFADRYLGYDDALYAACRLIEIVAGSGKPLSAQLSGLPKLVSTPEIRVDCADEVKFQVVERVRERLKSTYNVIGVDGVRVRFEHGWGLVRASNTQPVLVMRFEAESDDWLKKYRGEMEAALEEAKADVV
jgi:phosphomannomutase/phosphoglucomutase